jgi:hypothetical protein
MNQKTYGVKIVTCFMMVSMSYQGYDHASHGPQISFGTKKTFLGCSSWNLTNTQLRTAPNSKIPCENSESTTGEVYNAKQPDTEPPHEIIIFEMHLETQFWNSSNKQTEHSGAFWSYVSSGMESHVSIKEPQSTSREQPKLCSRE